MHFAGEMPTARRLSVLVPMIVVLLLIMVVKSQPTVDYDDDDASRQSPTLDGAVISLINKGFAEVKNLLRSEQQTCSCSTVNSLSLCKLEKRI